ncbi:TraR/DksA family transcriptional regulator [Streptomyces cavernicola]|uniref:TraR/DksA C4-type zinc finger protein n=1 Tax=Streptomyces cavernicola TaxID=3043613 RepID=A0ABT6SL95_9ACTN|nr:TraR/DksA C4-type zinc finger protein [Streptomyces sp. B-S-A6]MDI3408965.1 TraR/DksA C4-type zinc finger protein [Streptomyces sp. B-S-A6]
MPLDTTRPESRPERLTAYEARQRLQQERDSRLTQLQAIEEAGSSAVADSVLSAQTTSIRDVLKEIDAAFDRLEQGTYGDCLRCAKPIPIERLEILPYVRACVGCQQCMT